MAEKKCLECQKLINGRTDKKFCDDGCRNSYNNKLNSQADAIVRTVNAVLRKNRNILRGLLLNSEKITVSDKMLKVPGFNFEYFTHVYETRAGAVYRFCYEYGYLSIGEGVYMVVKRQSGKR
jgi:hypothetical protein